MMARHFVFSSFLLFIATFIGVIDSRSLNWDSAEIVDPARHSLKHLPPELVNFCENKEDDVYSLGCVSKYIKCLAGATVLKRCPFKLVLDTTTKECTHRTDADVCRSSTFAEPTVTTTISTRAVPTTTTVPTEQAAPQGAYFVEYTNFCARKRNGNYALGCIRQYVTCANRRLAIRECAAKLIFSESSDRCVQWWKVEACRGLPTPSTEPPTTTSPVMSDIAQTGRTTVVTEGPGLPAASEASTAVTTTAVPDTTLELVNFCENKEDDVYSLGCVSKYIKCLAGATVLKRCPFKLVLDTTTKECTHRTDADVCRSSTFAEPTVTTTISTRAVPTTTTVPTEQAAPQGAYFVEYTNFCARKRNGNYALGCIRQYVTCANRRLAIRECAAKLIFSESSDRCVQWWKVEACRGLPTPSTEPPTTTSPVMSDIAQTGRTTVVTEGPGLPAASEASTAVTTTAVPDTTLDLLSTCVGQADGTYANGCSSEFIACVEGSASILRCSDSLVYDEKSHRCLGREYVEACGGSPPTVAVTEPAATEASTSFDVTESTTGEFACDALPDGMYARHCSSTFIACVGGQAIAMQCPAPLIYDPYVKQCAPKATVRNCNETGQFNGAFEAQPTVVNDLTQNILDEEALMPSPSSGPEFSCSGLPDGIYSEECSPVFVLCLAGNRTGARCPGHLKYDAVTQMCRRKNRVPGCMRPGAGVSTTPASGPSTTATATISEVQLDVAVSSTPVTWPTMSTEFSCTDLPDGVYAQGCSSQFVVCVARRAFLMTCPANMKYDDLSKRCLDEQEVPACQQLPMDVSTESRNDMTCAGRVDGPIAFGCSAVFVRCSFGAASFERCENDTKFDIVTRRCLKAAYVSACRGRPTQSTVQSTISPCPECPPCPVCPPCPTCRCSCVMAQQTQSSVPTTATSIETRTTSPPPGYGLSSTGYGCRSDDPWCLQTPHTATFISSTLAHRTFPVDRGEVDCSLLQHADIINYFACGVSFASHWVDGQYSRVI
ncbi:Chondroitin proteoglycan 2 [Toxocara canis]|uniref:Chondroitin proteoglycan 2 n=1 Tax=Toxocara canis TaxID=6265 RepID=A0A0B2W1I8_TOXCA|nr:Chondroitin proteoglycan 2 [Toxocara canis]